MEKSSFRIACVPGDDSGPEAMSETLKILKKVEEKKPDLKLIPVELDIGFSRYQRTNECVEVNGDKYGGVSNETMKTASDTDAMLYTAVAGANFPSGIRSPWRYIRQYFNCLVNVRIGKSFPNSGAFIEDLDVILVRDQSEGLFVAPEFNISKDVACSVVVASKEATERLARHAFEIARANNRKKVACVHKSQVSRKMYALFYDVCKEVSQEYPDIEFESTHTDYVPYALVVNPEEVDVIITDSFYGDIISGEFAALAGSLGLSYGAVYGEDYAIFKPNHGTAPDIAGMNKINPGATVLSAKMMLEWLGQRYNNHDCLNAAEAIEDAIVEILAEGKVLTTDIGGSASTSDFAAEIINKL